MNTINISETRNSLLGKYLAEVIQDHAETERDHIEKFVEKQIECETEKVCAECGGANDKSYRIWRNCGGPLVTL